MLPHVVRFNAAGGENPYSDLDADARRLAARVEGFLEAGRLPRRLRECGATGAMIPRLAQIAAGQWTATFNPRAVTEADLRGILERAM